MASPDKAVSYADDLAVERQTGGYQLLEVQTAINVLEEAVWRAIIPRFQASSRATLSRWYPRCSER
jgi:hypothetical protein